jgi:hypothetical protein
MATIVVESSLVLCMIIAMDEDQRQKLYDEIVDVDLNGPQPGQPGAGSLVKLFFKALYDYCETPEEILAAALVDSRSYTPHNIAPTKNYSEFAAIRWPWGDARGILRAGGRTYWEARLRLRDKLVESARALTKDHPQENERPSSASPEED